jgi:hypothetical protein
LELRQEAPNQEISMSTSLLYHAFGIRGYEYIRTEYRGGQLIFTTDQERKTSGVPCVARGMFSPVAELSASSGRCRSIAVPQALSFRYRASPAGPVV